MDTMVTLIRMNPQMDFPLPASAGRPVMAVDTSRTAGCAGDVPLNEPDVMDWIRDYIAEQTEQLLAPDAGAGDQRE